MNRTLKVVVVLGLVFAIGWVMAEKRKDKKESAVVSISQQTKVPTSQATQPATKPAAQLPRLLDLGADKCRLCKMMKPILDELRDEYKGRMQVDFINVWENHQAGDQYGIQAIPTQIFFDASGKELFRHEGFMSKEAILDKWKELKVEFKK